MLACGKGGNPAFASTHLVDSAALIDPPALVVALTAHTAANPAGSGYAPLAAALSMP